MHRSAQFSRVILGASLALAGCSPTASGMDVPGVDAPTPMTDAGSGTDTPGADVPEVDAPATADAPMGTDAPALTCSAPAGPYGTAIGAVFAGFDLPTCGGADYDFYADGYCAPDHAATVVIFSALWCTVCQSESTRLNAAITEPYRARGVRVVQVLVDGARPGTAVTSSACQGWVDTFRLTNDVVMDATREMTSAYYPEGSFPVTLIVDEAGVIRYRDVHGGRGLTGLATALDGVLGT